MTQIDREQIDAILPYLKKFEDSGFSVGEWVSPPRQVLWFDYGETAMQFHQALYDHGWVSSSFDWGEWQEKAHKYIESPEKVKSADAETIRKLFTTHVRADRFCEGHLAAMYKNGHNGGLLRRLKAIRDSMG